MAWILNDVNCMFPIKMTLLFCTIQLKCVYHLIVFYFERNCLLQQVLVLFFLNNNLISQYYA